MAAESLAPSQAVRNLAAERAPDQAIVLVHAAEGEPLARIKELFTEYAASLRIDLCFQNFAAELEALPGDYVGPSGALLLAQVGGQAAGCVALRALAHAQHHHACEMKRLYVRPAYRHLGLGRVLTQHLLDKAAQLRYSCMLLDTLDDMTAARGLYQSLGFEEIEPYCFNPIAGAHYLKLNLNAQALPG